MTVYVIADIKVTDTGWVPEYAASVHDIVHKHGGKYLARSGNVKTFLHLENSRGRASTECLNVGSQPGLPSEPAIRRRSFMSIHTPDKFCIGKDGCRCCRSLRLRP